MCILAAGGRLQHTDLFAQDHLRILSGLYGMLRPLDQCAYRLEMGRKFGSNGAQSLYEFWGDKITKN